MTFEENVKKLEEILKQMESGKLTLEEMNKSFEDACKISKESYEMLQKSKGKITVLTKEIEKLTEKPL